MSQMLVQSNFAAILSAYSALQRLQIITQYSIQQVQCLLGLALCCMSQSLCHHTVLQRIVSFSRANNLYIRDLLKQEDKQSLPGDTATVVALLPKKLRLQDRHQKRPMLHKPDYSQAVT